jgi:uncharacterized membrane protein YkvA (DUF1232 family)
VNKTINKNNKQNKVRMFPGLFLDFFTYLRILWMWINGNYPVFPKRSTAVLLVAVFYVLLPIDFLPDLIPIIGWVDDITVLLFAYRFAKSDIEKFKMWQKNQPTQP